MKKLATLIGCVTVLALPAASLAADGKGGSGFDAHLARATAKVEKVTAKCNTAPAPVKCADVKARIADRLDAWAERLQARLDKVNARPDSERKTAVVAELEDRLEQVQALAAQL